LANGVVLKFNNKDISALEVVYIEDLPTEKLIWWTDTEIFKRLVFVLNLNLDLISVQSKRSRSYLSMRINRGSITVADVLDVKKAVSDDVKFYNGLQTVFFEVQHKNYKTKTQLMSEYMTTKELLEGAKSDLAQVLSDNSELKTLLKTSQKEVVRLKMKIEELKATIEVLEEQSGKPTKVKKSFA
jgi:hypothetical protein